MGKLSIAKVAILIVPVDIIQMLNELIRKKGEW